VIEQDYPVIAATSRGTFMWAMSWLGSSAWETPVPTNPETIVVREAAT
jgi:hypothetical protein